MGSPLSPIVANIFMEDFEARALSSARLLPRLWKRCVDDTNVIWPHGPEELDRSLITSTAGPLQLSSPWKKRSMAASHSWIFLYLGIRMAFSPTRRSEKRLILSSIFMHIPIISLLKSWGFLTPSLLVPLGSLIVGALERRDPISSMSLWRMDIAGT